MSTTHAPEHKRLAGHASADLHYRLVKGPVSFSPMLILRSRTISWGEWSVTFYVLGASHAMHLAQGRRQITEILSCLRPPNESRSVAEVSTTGEGCISSEMYGLCMTCKLENLPTGMLEPFAEWAQDSRSGNVLEHAYPNPDLDVPSWTRLKWQVTGNSLRLSTVHTYPHEGVSVYSETRVRDVNRSKMECANGG
jgi:hypothetical protein